MPEYHQIESHIELKTDADFPLLVNKFKSFLENIGLLNEEIKNWIQTLSWEVAEDGFVYTPSSEHFQIPCFGSTLTVRPLILGITPVIFPALGNNWITFQLLLISEEIDDYSKDPIVRYKRKPINKVLELMNAFTKMFPDSPVFLTHEAQDGEP